MMKLIVGGFLSVGGLYLAFRQMDLSNLGLVLYSVNWQAILLAVVIMVVSVWVRAVRWRIILSPIRDVSTYPLFSATMIGYFGNSVLPLRLGEFMRAYALSRGGHSVTTSAAFGTLIVERMLDMIGIMILILVLFSIYDIPSWLGNSGIILSSFVIGASLLLLWIASSHNEWLARVERIKILNKGVGIKLKAVLRSFIEGLVTLRNIRSPFSLIFHSTLLWIMYWIISLLTVQAVGIELSWLQVAILMVSVTMVIILPSAPGFIGTYHAGAVEILVEVLGVSKTPAQVYALINHAIGFVPLVIIGAFYFFRSSLKFRDVKSLEVPSGI